MECGILADDRAGSETMAEVMPIVYIVSALPRLDTKRYADSAHIATK